MAIYKKIDVQGDVHTILWKCFGNVVGSLAKKGVHDIFITSMREGLHAVTSFHYIGMAIDFKRSGIENERSVIEAGIKRFCNRYKLSVNDFDLIEYTDSRNIWHLELDPKNSL